MASTQEDISKRARRQIRRYREEAGMSQEELGQAIGKSNANISDIERGRLGVSFSDMVLIAKALNKPLENFAPRNQLATISRRKLLDSELEIAALYSRLLYTPLERAVRNLLEELVAFAEKDEFARIGEEFIETSKVVADRVNREIRDRREE